MFVETAYQSVVFRLFCQYLRPKSVLLKIFLLIFFSTVKVNDYLCNRKDFITHDSLASNLKRKLLKENLSCCTYKKKRTYSVI